MTPADLTTAESTPALDNFLSLHRAEIDAANARAGIAQSLTDMMLKVAKGNEEVLKARLENVARYLDIKWDIAAHDSLVRARNAALRKAHELDREFDRVKLNASRIGVLLVGGSQHQVRDAWIAFQFFYGRHAPFAAVPTEQPQAIYDRKNWIHPDRREVGVMDLENVYGLLNWARINSLFPAEGTPAWTFLRDRIAGLATAAKQQADALAASVAAAEKEAREIQAEDWGRLKQ